MHLYARNVLELTGRSIAGHVAFARHADAASGTSSFPDSTVEKRSSSTTTCAANDNSAKCEKPTGDSNTLPIVLAAVIPIAVALVVLVFLHRRHKKKLRLEDKNDKYKSLDFGMDEVSGGGKGGKVGKKDNHVPTMTVTDMEKSIRGHAKGFSMDIDSPYMMPPGLAGSRESYHSLSRNTPDPHDPYRPVTFMSSDKDYSGGYPRMKGDNASIFTGSSIATDGPNARLLVNAQRMSKSFPSRSDSMSPPGESPVDQDLPNFPPRKTSGSLAPRVDDKPRDSYSAFKPAEMKQSDHYFAGYTPTEEPMSMSKSEVAAPVDSAYQSANSSRRETSSDDHPPRLQSMASSAHDLSLPGGMGESRNRHNLQITPPSPPQVREATQHEQQAAQRVSFVAEDAPVYQPAPRNNLGIDFDPSKRMSMSVRPLPPTELMDPSDDPEARANRIRSFYKEYFNDSKADAVPQNATYHEDYDQEFLSEGAMFDPETGNFVVAQAPYAEPITRRAMTPPPRAPPKFRGGPGLAPRAGPRGHISSGSTSRYLPPRGFSAMSGRHPPPKKNLPPPTDLKSLATPHLLKDDSAIFNAADFAPPISYRDRQAGRRPDSPLGVSRPYSPAFAPASPLTSSFDDLSAIPSPHMLRKSGTFTSLDFAPPPRFRDVDSGSDAGSIRSNRSGMSQRQLASLRAGAYRVSRLPAEAVGTKNDLMDALKPTWDLRGVNPGKV